MTSFLLPAKLRNYSLSEAAANLPSVVSSRLFSSSVPGSHREICIFHSKIVPGTLQIRCQRDALLTCFGATVADLAFGKSYGQLESGKIHHGVALIKQWLNLFVYMMQVPWLMVFLSHCPGVDDPMTTLRNFARASLRERETNESDQPDVMSHIINEKGASSRWPLNDADLISDTMTLQVAGSDTSSSSIMHMLYYSKSSSSIRPVAECQTLLPFHSKYPTVMCRRHL